MPARSGGALMNPPSTALNGRYNTWDYPIAIGRNLTYSLQTEGKYF